MIPGSTQHLRFREMATSDLDDMAALLGDPDVMRFYPAPRSRDESLRWITWNLRNYRDHGHGLWIIETHDGTFVGDCGLTWQPVNGLRKLEVGYHVRAAMQGGGLATEAARACRDLAHQRCLASELVAIVHRDNVASRRVAEKLGMHYIDDLQSDPGGVSHASHTVLGMDL